VTRTEELFHPRRAPPLAEPPARGRAFFGWGLGVGLLFCALGLGASGFGGGRADASPALVATVLRGILRWVFGLLVAGFGLAAGFVGCFLLYVWIGTDHLVAHRNQNILLCAPFALALAVLGVGVALGRPGATRKAFVVAAAASATTILACLVKVGLLRPQENGALIAFFLPVWLGIVAGLARLRSPAGGIRASGTSKP
jgi:hypothetical protein